MNNNRIFIPKFVGQRSDMEYGSVVTHENYNEKLNLNMEQGDYNTEVLRLLFTESDINKVYRIPYLEKYTDDTVKDLRETFYDLQGQIDVNKEGVSANKAAISTVANMLTHQSTTIANIIAGKQMVGHAAIADNLSGAATAGEHMYYGTDYDGAVGYFELPDAMYAEDINSSSPDIAGIYFTPRENSVAENMLTESVRSKLNRTSITAYPELSDLPSINSVTLTGNKTLADLGIQPIGPYLTEIPESYVQKSYVDNAVAPKLDATTAASTYATRAALDIVSADQAASYNNIVANYARVFIGSVPSNYTKKNGDILVDL